MVSGVVLFFGSKFGVSDWLFAPLLPFPYTVIIGVWMEWLISVNCGMGRGGRMEVVDGVVPIALFWDWSGVGNAN